MGNPIFFYTLNGEYVAGYVVDDVEGWIELSHARVFIPQQTNARNNTIGFLVMPVPLHDENATVRYNKACIVRFMHPTQEVLDKYTEATSGIQIARHI